MRDQLSPEDLRFTPPELSASVVLDAVSELWGLSGDAAALRGERDQNFSLKSADGSRYVIKVASPVENPALADYQTRAMLHVADHDSDIPVPRVIPTLSGQISTTIEVGSDTHIVRVLSWVDGEPLGNFPPPSLGTVAEIGRLQGRLCRALTDFSHPAATEFMPWDSMNGLVESNQLAPFLGTQSDLCASALLRLREESLPRMRELPRQVIHNDAHGFNLLCDPQRPDNIAGLIDFGDLAFRPLVIDLSVSLKSLLERCPQPLEVAATTVQAFRRECSIGNEQLAFLLDAIIARAILSVQLEEYRAANVKVDFQAQQEEIRSCRRSLEKVLAIDPAAFYDAVTTDG